MDPTTTAFIVSTCVSAIVVVGIMLFLKRGKTPGSKDLPSGPVTVGF